MVTFKQKISWILGLHGIFLGALIIGGYPYLYHAIFRSVSEFQAYLVKFDSLIFDCQL